MSVTKLLLNYETTKKRLRSSIWFLRIDIAFSLKLPKHAVESHLTFVLITNMYLVGIINGLR
jgi:hypothetical protein